METEASKVGSIDGITADGAVLGQRFAAGLNASASGTATSNVGSDRRNCTRQVAHVVLYLSATDYHNAK